MIEFPRYINSHNKNSNFAFDMVLKMANPAVNHQEQTRVSSSFNCVNGGNLINGNPALESSSGTPAMNHNPGIAMDWSIEEQAILEDGLELYHSETILMCYAKIALQLHNKTVRDVALRVRWMRKKESCKKRKDDHNLTRKAKDKRERVSDPSAKSSHFAAHSNINPYALPIFPMDNNDGIPCKVIGGQMGKLLEQNAQALNQISANLSALQIQDNIELFCQTRDNIHKILNHLSDQSEAMKHMPSLPVKLNEELANAILPRTNIPMLS